MRFTGLFLITLLSSAFAYADADLPPPPKKAIKSMPYDNNEESNKVLSGNRILIDIDYTEGFALQRPAGQIVLGNPIIADIKVQDDKNIFIVGKSPGRTNMLIYGRDGLLQSRHTIIVRDPNDYVTVYSGAENKLHYDCMPVCQRVLRIEDKGAGYEEQSAKVLSHIDKVDQRADKSSAQDGASNVQIGQ